MIKMQEKLEKMASIDHLTGIYNRHKFEQLFKIEEERTLRYGSPFAIIMFDIDHFKNINDTYGHDIGDLILKKVVEIINKQLRQTDAFTRWGGEEFVILCPGVNAEEASLLAGKLRHEIEVHSFEKVGSITASFGVSSYEKHESKDKLLKRVDNALYQAKETGRNRVVIK
jgi:diguanylate cyclase (GGDEF)-like protein